MGKNDDCSIFDVYIDGTLWLSFDGYAATATDMSAISINVEGDGLHLLEIKNRLEKNVNSSGYKLRFKSLYAQPAFDVTTIDYTYDGLSRLLEAAYNTDERVYDYSYDLAGNRKSDLLSGTGVTAANRYFGYNAANQLIAEGDTVDGNGDVIADYTYQYDANGNLVSQKDTVPNTLESYTWDRANRMLTVGDHSYVYDGLGNRIQQTISGTPDVVTDYLNDVQPGLVKLLRQDDGTNIDHFIHGVRGIHAVDDGTDWTWFAQDGLGSVRGLVDDVADVVSSHSYNPIGVPDSDYGAGFWFTGEQTDWNDLIYLRARYMNPNMGTFLSLDPFEGMYSRPMSLNGYSWVEGNMPNFVDPNGMFSCLRVCQEFCVNDFVPLKN